MPKAELTLKDSLGNAVSDRRGPERKDLAKSIKARFTVEYEGDVVNISPDGIAIRFHPLQSESLKMDNSVQVHMKMNGRIVSVRGIVRQLDEKHGFITIGMKYDRDEIALFDLNGDES